MSNRFFLTWRTKLRYDQCYTDFGATITRGQQVTYEVALLHHLRPEENRGNHHVYVDIVTAEHRLLRGQPLRIGWTWEGRRGDEQAPPVALDKPVGEPMANVPIYKGMKITCWLETTDGEVISERVSGLHGMVEDGDAGNSWHHNSFYIIFRERSLSVGEEEEPAPSEPGTHGSEDIEARLAALESDVNMLKRMAQAVLSVRESPIRVVNDGRRT